MLLSRRFLAAAIVAGAVIIGQFLTGTAVAEQEVTASSGLRYIDVKPGSGATAKPGQTAVVHYTGWLFENGQKGKKFDSSRDRGQPFAFPLGAGRVIRGWDEGVVGMKVGGQRTLIIPPQLGYGARGGWRRNPAECHPDLRHRTARRQIAVSMMRPGQRRCQHLAAMRAR